ncbi:hypothetical protein PFICI_07873 [Pestalotiopsis fici W106-1]|uniref:Zn(2)-C6 fungal-type domain-containing protein n=1 Tax=Pestalotiopsis fici (strain W106-1 / CGMCC3.15140) TaxID=1229662 RepID=W3X2W2_PESFW|nr:uncharacterized protein PFICI_07873 [Pestalotiopsis fici W106-1]ETS80344.1 hypothetical protein PFICI_07873 [Pestalotiopsis fici W106-1]
MEATGSYTAGVDSTLSLPPAGMRSHHPRVTQRAPLSCYPCSKRKRRCSRTVPCTNCVNRGISDQCHRETVVLAKNRPSLDQTARPRSAKTARVATTAHRTHGDSDRAHVRESPASHLPGQHHITDSAREQVAARPVNVESPSHGDLGNQDSTTDVYSQGSPVAFNHDGNLGSSPRQRDVDSHLSGEAANTLEALVWGSHKATAEVHYGRGRALNIQGSLSSAQEREVLSFHQLHVAWTHNVLHMPSFMRECQLYRQVEHSLPDAGWLTLYYAVLSLSFMYMHPQKAEKLGLPEASLLSQSFYDLAIESLHAAELATVNSMHALQAVCILLPCCHFFGDSKRIMILLAMANVTAQIMGLHRVQAKSERPESVSEVISREVQKRVWCCLCIQDSYLITFKRSYSISMAHCSTPPPSNCDEKEASISCNGSVAELPADHFTQSTFQIQQLKLSNISRALFDSVSSLERAGQGIHSVFDKVLEADDALVRFAQELPPWLSVVQQETLRDDDPCIVPAAGANADHPEVLQSVRRTLRISFLHKRIMIHRSLFCRSLTDKRFHYSYTSCLDAARTILKEY